MQLEEDPYAVLGVGRDATTGDLRRARNALLLRWHPDRSPDPEAASRAARINEAYAVLSDAALRARVDRGQSVRPAPAPPRPSTAPEGVPEERRASAQRRVVDRFGEQTAAAPARRLKERTRRTWSDTLARPASLRETRVRALRGVLPALFAFACWLALEHPPARWASMEPVLVPVLVPALLFGIAATGRALLGRPTRVRYEQWGRFTLSWAMGAVLAYAVARWVLPGVPPGFSAAIGPVVAPLALLTSALAVYGLARSALD